MTDGKRIVVVGSVNLDIVVTVDRLPVAGETVSGGTLSQFPGGKGANQALAARKLGAEVTLVACVGDDANADAALALLSEGGVDLSACRRDESAATGVALIAVSSDGENQIVVVPGANRASRPDDIELPNADALICQLEVPVATLQRATETFAGFISINLAPAIDVPENLIDCADLIVVNETEAEFYGDNLNAFEGLLAITYGGKGAVLKKGGEDVARSRPPEVQVVDTTGAGDTFTSALTLAIIEGREFQAALDFACAAGAAATTKAGAQPSLPSRAEVESL
jgi:ribokinase